MVIIIINPRRACAARITVVVLCVCVCLSGHAILAVRAIKKCIMKDTIVLSVRFAAILKWRFSLKNCLIRKLERFYLLRQGRPFLVDAYPAWNVSYTLRYMFAYV